MREQQETSKRRKRDDSSIISTAGKIASASVAASGILLLSQALYIAYKTPRLPPPEYSGHDFHIDGLLVDKRCEASDTNDEEFKLLLLGDSPVEGIGNDTHDVALGGRTAEEFSKALGQKVRYWSYGKSGLTASGIKDEMFPYLKKIISIHGHIDAVVISCGVNNVLIGQTAKTFGDEVMNLIESVQSCTSMNTEIILMELLDFKWMPFIPYPLSKIASWKSRALQSEMESIVKHYQDCDHCGKSCIVKMAYLPPVEQILKDKSHHNILSHIKCSKELDDLQLGDFFADDGFHPAKHGNIVIGKILADTYTSKYY